MLAGGVGGNQRELELAAHAGNATEAVGDAVAAGNDRETIWQRRSGGEVPRERRDAAPDVLIEDAVGERDSQERKRQFVDLLALDDSATMGMSGFGVPAGVTTSTIGVLASVAPELSLTSTSTAKLPVCVGVPDSTPSGLMFMPAGSTPNGDGENVYGPVPPATFNGKEYGALTTAAGRSRAPTPLSAGDDVLHRRHAVGERVVGEVAGVAVLRRAQRVGVEAWRRDTSHQIRAGAAAR